MTSLHLAVSKSFEEIVKILIKHGSNVNLQDQVLILFFFFYLIFVLFFVVVLSYLLLFFFKKLLFC